MSGFTKTALRDVSEHRERVVVPVNANEVARLVDESYSAEWLLTHKQRTIRNGHAAPFFEKARVTWLGRKLPQADDKLVLEDRSIAAVAMRTEAIEQIVFSRDMPDLSWHRLGGSPPGLHLDLDIKSPSELRGVLAFLHEHFGLSGHGSFSIGQSGIGWYGFGAAEFLAEVQGLAQRYDKHPKHRWHHSEELLYFDELGESGTVLLYSRQRVGGKPYLHSTDLFVHFSGVPVDQRRLRELCLEASAPNAFMAADGHCKIERISLRKPVPLKVLGLVHSTDPDRDTTVSGVVAENPFFGRPRRLAVVAAAAKSLSALALEKTENLVCSLKDWHGVGAKVDGYSLLGLDYMRLPGGVVLRPVATWGKLLFCPHGHATNEDQWKAATEALIEDKAP